MKFIDGHWHMRAGVTPNWPAHVHDVEVEPDALTVYAPTQRLTNRADTLNQALLTVRFTSPLPNTIRVQVWRHKGGRPLKPAFQLHTEAPPITIRNDEAEASLTSGSLTVRVPKQGDWRVDFLDGERVITSSGWRAMASMDTPDSRYAVEQLALGVGECVYGLGERFTPFVKNGQAVLVRRDLKSKEIVPLEALPARLPALLDDIQATLLGQAREFLAANTRPASTYEEFKSILETQRGFVQAPWCGGEGCEEKIKTETMATIRVIPLHLDGQPVAGGCVCCGQPGQATALFARAY